MKVILQENIDGVGYLGDLLTVADGFARNYLLPRGKAVEANTRNIKGLETSQACGLAKGEERNSSLTRVGEEKSLKSP